MRCRFGGLGKVLFAVIMFAAACLIVRYIGADPYQKEVEWTVFSLIVYRQNVELFRETNSRYPESLLELRQYMGSNRP